MKNNYNFESKFKPLKMINSKLPKNKKNEIRFANLNFDSKL